jgi:hypothetical protein
LNPWASNHRIARVAKSIRELGDIPSPPIGQLRKMIPEVLDVVRRTNSEDPRLGGKSLSHSIAEKLNLPVSVQTINAIRNLLRYPSRRHRQPLTKTQIVQIPMTY